MSEWLPPSPLAAAHEPPDVPSLGPAPEDPGPGWPWWMAPAAILLAFVGVITAALIVSGIAQAAGADPTGKGGLAIILTLLQDLAFIAAPLFLAGVVAKRLRPAYFGLRAPRLGPAIGWTLLALFAYYLFAGLWTLEVAGEQKQDDLFKSLGVSRGALEVALLGVMVCVLAPLAEEFLFRGFCFTALRPTLGVVGAAVAVGAGFGAIHIGSTPPILLPVLAMLGFLLCLLVWRTRSLYPAIGVHALNNSFAFSMLQNWSVAETLPVIAGSLAACALVLLPFRDRGPLANRL